MSTEAAYRAALRWYPRSWRRANEDVMVGTLLDVADAEGRDAPSRAELRDLRRSGLAAWADAALPGGVRDGVAGISLGAGTAVALAMLTGQAWAAWPSRPTYPDSWISASPELVAPDALVWQLLIHPALWVLGALAALMGRSSVSRVLLLATIPASAISMTQTEQYFLLRPSLFTLVLMGALAVVACVGRARRRPQLIATGIAGVLVASWLAFLGPRAGTYFPRDGLVDLIGSPWPAVVLVSVTVLLLAIRQWLAGATVMIAAAPWLVSFLGDQLWFSGFGWDLGFIGQTVMIVVIACIVPLAFALAARRYARALWHSPSESSDSRTSASRPSSTR